MSTIKHDHIDKICLHADRFLRTVFGKVKITDRPDPAQDIPESDLTDKERKHVTGLMRINHVGEVCAQALYQGQAITARDDITREQMHEAAIEENDHLNWCKGRIDQLGSHTSYLNPLWYTGALAIGITAGIAGDKWSLGFLAETEKQVVAHLNKHLGKLPEHDKRSQAILQQMAIDEAKHEQSALDHGGAELPKPIKSLMKFSSKIMTSIAYKV